MHFQVQYGDERCIFVCDYGSKRCTFMRGMVDCAVQILEMRRNDFEWESRLRRQDCRMTGIHRMEENKNDNETW